MKNGQQVIIRPLFYQDNVSDSETLFLDRIVESVMDAFVSSEAEFWERIFNVVKNYAEINEPFFASPNWKDICYWLEENSFSFNFNKELFLPLFSSLIKSSDKLYEVFAGNVCPQNVCKLCNNYLSEYYHLINRLQEEGVLCDDFVYKSQLLHMLKTGCICKEKDNIFNIDIKSSLSFFSPIFLEELRVFYSFIENDVWYQRKLSNCIKKQIKYIYKDVILIKFAHLFSLEMTYLNDRYVSTYYNVGVPQLMNRNDFSSIELIRPVRWIDKIKAYVENLKNSKKDKQDANLVKIAVVGYVKLKENKDCCYSQELKMFYETLSKIRTQDFDGAYNFEIDIFPNLNDEYFKDFIGRDCVYSNSKNGISINIQFVDYLKFFSLRNNDEKNICKTIKEYNIVLLEDVPNIYTNKYMLLKKSGKDFPNNDSDYASEYQRMDFKNEDFFVVNYKYTPINLLIAKLELISMNKDTYDDTLKYKLNQPLIDYLKEYMNSLKEDAQDHNVYIFTSKKSGVEFSDYIQYNFTREERYNAKSFYLITLSNRQSKGIRIYSHKEKKSFIVFSLWNMLKNIDYNFVENEVFFKDILHCKKEEVCALSMKVYIKMTWNLPKKKFLFEICFDPMLKSRDSEIDSQQLKDFLDNLFGIIFPSEKNLFARCMSRSFLNTVYSQMEYIEDAVFYCVLYNGFSKGNEPSIEVCFSDFKERYVYSVNQPIFWNLTRILKLLNEDIFRRDRIWEINKIYEINQDIYTSAGFNTLNALFQCFKDICERYGYTNTNIYVNLANLLT